MDIYEKIKTLMILRKTNERNVASTIGDTPQGMNRKIKADMKLSYLDRIANGMNCKVEINFIDHETGEKII